MIHIGFIGLGGMANNHLQRLQQIPGVKIAAGVEPDFARREQAVLKYGLQGYEDYLEMLTREELDGVYICLPPFAHHGQELEIIKRGLALFVEKPVGLDYQKAKETASAIKAAGIINASGYMCRYLDVVAEADRIIGTKPIIAMRGFYFAPLPPTTWWRRAELSGGQIIEQATHIVDLMRHFAGEAVRVSGEGYHGAMIDIENYNVDDASSVNFRFQNGAIANLMCTCALNNQYCPGLEIITRGHRIWLDLPPRPVRLLELDGVDQEVTSGHDRFIREDEAFIQAIKTRDQNLIKSDYYNAVKTLQLSLAAQEAVNNNAVIELGAGID